MDEVLHYVWDPIGVSGVPTARDEYYSYLPHVFGLLQGSAKEESIAAYLGQVRTDRMGLPADLKRDKQVASVLIDWKEAIHKKFAQ